MPPKKPAAAVINEPKHDERLVEQCDECGVRYRTAKDLAAHAQVVHGVYNDA